MSQLTWGSVMVGSSASWTSIAFAMTTEDIPKVPPPTPTLARHNQVIRKRQSSVCPKGWLGHISHWPQATLRQCFFSSPATWQLLLWLVLAKAMGLVSPWSILALHASPVAHGLH